jgi:transposase
MHAKQQAVTDFLMHKNVTPTRIHQQIFAFCGEGTVKISTVHHWVINLRDNGGILNLNDQPHSGRPKTATSNLNKQKCDKLSEKNG